MSSPARSILPRMLLVVLCLLSQAAIASAHLWHHHAGEAVAESCVVCTAAAASDRVPGSAGAALPAPARVGWLAIEQAATPPVRPAPRAVARGPPLCA